MLPRIAPADAVALAGFEGPLEAVLGWMPVHPDWLDDPQLTGWSVFAGFEATGAVADGRITPLPIRLGGVATFLEEQPPDVAVLAGVRRGDGYAFHRCIGWADALARVAGRVVVEVDERGVDLGGPAIEGNVVAEVARPHVHDEMPPPRPIDDVDRRIAEHVVSLLPVDATVQFGIGGVAEAIAATIDRPVRLWSGLLTDTAAGMYDRGLLREPVVASYTWGGAPIEALHAAGMLDLVAATVTHDLGRLAAIDRFVACNGALQVGLDGSVNLERVGGRTIAGIGGHADFSAGATRSRGGISVVATRSTTSTGVSCIVPQVEVVSTQRSDIGVVVTEHGIADLRGVSDAERARRLIAVAAPEHRPALR
jgi:acyl CoA:acetate/3-ketoacid CoA transferase beta subunit